MVKKRILKISLCLFILFLFICTITFSKTKTFASGNEIYSNYQNIRYRFHVVGYDYLEIQLDLSSLYYPELEIFDLPYDEDTNCYIFDPNTLNVQLPDGVHDQYIQFKPINYYGILKDGFTNINEEYDIDNQGNKFIHSDVYSIYCTINNLTYSDSDTLENFSDQIIYSLIPHSLTTIENVDIYIFAFPEILLDSFNNNYYYSDNQ